MWRQHTQSTAELVRYARQYLVYPSYQVYTVEMAVSISTVPGCTAQQGLQQSSSIPKHTTTAAEAAWCNACTAALVVLTRTVPGYTAQQSTAGTTAEH